MSVVKFHFSALLHRMSWSYWFMASGISLQTSHKQCILDAQKLRNFPEFSRFWWFSTWFFSWSKVEISEFNWTFVQYTEKSQCSVLSHLIHLPNLCGYFTSLLPFCYNKYIVKLSLLPLYKLWANSTFFLLYPP